MANARIEQDNSAIAAGQIEQAVNEAIGDIIPGAHVAIVYHTELEAGWVFEITLPAPGPVTLTDEALTVDPNWLQHLIGEAEDLVRAAKLRMLTAWGIDTSGITGVPGE